MIKQNKSGDVFLSPSQLVFINLLESKTRRPAGVCYYKVSIFKISKCTASDTTFDPQV